MQVLEQNDSLTSEGKILGRSPRDGTELDPVSLTPPQNIPDIVKRARAAQASWSALSPKERGARVAKLRGELLGRAESLARIMMQEQGKSPAESFTSELLPSADLFTYWAKEGPRLMAPEARTLNPINFPKKAGLLRLVPKGVVGLITPWNYPLALPLRTLVPALVAGNAVVWKPSEYAPRIGAAVGALFDLLGVPDLVQVIQGAGDAGQVLIESGVDHVVFTGSEAAGRKVAVACADRLIGCSLELGGKDAALVLRDADLDRAADGIVWGAFANAGQNCASVERVYVVESVAPAFIEKVVERTRALTLGDVEGEVYDVGPLVRPAGLKTVEQHVADALEQGATVRVGGKATGKGLHFQPTVLTDVTHDMAVMTVETFGPLLPIAVVENEAEAVRRANESMYGLTTSIWTRDLSRGRALADQINSGVVTLNNHAFTGAVPHAPWHGRGHSGGGVTNSKYAFFELTQPSYVLVDRAKAKELWWFPHNAALTSIGRSLAALLGRGGSKVSALTSLVRSFLKRWK